MVASEAPFADAPAECGIGQQRRHPVGVAGLVIGGDHQHIGHHAGHVVAVTTGYRAARGLDRTLFMKLATCQWIRDHRHVILCGPTGIGKSWLACALCHKACREDFSVLYHRVPRLFAALDLARVDLLILDNWGPQVMTADHRRDLMEIVEDRYGRGSLLITSQVPVDRWHEIIGDPTLADAILDRIVHAAYRIDLTGESLRKRRGGARRVSISRSTSTPASDDNSPPSNRATTALPEAGDRPGRGRVTSTMAGVASENGKIGFGNQLLRPFKGLRYTRQPRCIFQART